MGIQHCCAAQHDGGSGVEIDWPSVFLRRGLAWAHPEKSNPIMPSLHTFTLIPDRRAVPYTSSPSVLGSMVNPGQPAGGAPTHN